MRVTFFYSLLWLAAALLTACGGQDDAAQIARAIEEMQGGIEDKNSSAVMEHLAADFRTDNGLQRKQIQGLMFYQFRRYPRIEVLITNQEVRVRDEQADVTLNALVMGGETLLPERGNLYAVSMRWQKSGGDWLLSRIKWRRRIRS